MIVPASPGDALPAHVTTTSSSLSLEVGLAGSGVVGGAKTCRCSEVEEGGRRRGSCFAGPGVLGPGSLSSAPGGPLRSFTTDTLQ
jgi:hypothetical protein